MDDGTGVISTTFWFSEQELLQSQRSTFDLGQVVTILGKLNDFKDVRQVSIQQIRQELDPNWECVRWLEIIKFLKEACNKDTFFLDIKDVPTDMKSLENQEEMDFERLLENVSNGHVVLSQITKLFECYLKQENRIEFKYSDILNWPYFEDLIIKALHYQYNISNPSETRIHSMLRRLVSDLVTNAKIYLMDLELDVYRYISHESIDECILTILKSEKGSFSFLPIKLWINRMWIRNYFI